MTQVAAHCVSDSGCTKMTHESRMLHEGPGSNSQPRQSWV